MGKVRCGSIVYNNIEIPATAIIETAPSGRPYYKSMIYEDKILIRYVDNDGKEYKSVPINKF